jgi:transposase
MPQSSTLSGGLDVHQDARAVAYGAQAHGAAVVDLGTIGTRHCDSDQLTRKLRSKANHLALVDEAGPWGYGL